MTAWRLFRSLSVLLLVLVAALPLYAARIRPTTVPKVQPTTAPKIDPRAVQSLRQMSDYLSGLQAFSVHVNTTRDLMLPSDQALTSDLSYDLMIRRPNELRINMVSAAQSAQLFYNGSTLTVYTPEKNYYAVRSAPPTIAELATQAQNRGLSMPLADFLAGNPNQIAANISSATFVGTSYLGGVMTDQLAFRQRGGIDWQIWIQEGPSPLPRRIMIVDRRVKDFPRFVATLSNWNTNPTFDRSVFTFVPPQGARQIPFGQLPKVPASYMRRAPTR